MPVPVTHSVLSLHYHISFSWHIIPSSLSRVPGPAFLTVGFVLRSAHCFSLGWLIPHPSSLLASWTPLHFGQFSLHVFQQLSSSCCCDFLASCVNTVQKSTSKRDEGKFRFLGRGLKSMSVGVILSSFGSDHT